MVREAVRKGRHSFVGGRKYLHAANARGGGKKTEKNKVVSERKGRAVGYSMRLAKLRELRENEKIVEEGRKSGYFSSHIRLKKG